MFAKVAAFASLVGILSLAVGCAAPAEESAEQSESNLSTGTFKLYEDDAAVDSECDLHTELTLSTDRTPNGLHASLRNVVDGTCRILVAPEARSFRLELESESCGSMIYKGTETVSGKKHEITITDNRSRLCRDVVPAVVVEESLDGERRLLQAH